MEGEPIVLAALAIVASIAGALVWLLKKLYSQNETTVRDNTKSNAELAKAIAGLSSSTEARNKSDLEFKATVLSKLETIDNKADRNHSAIIKRQTVKEQTVEHQTIKETS